MSYETITATQEKILEGLNDYRFLTVAQMQRIGIAHSKQTLYKTLKVLQDHKKNLVDYIDFGTFPTIGRLSRFYYLTKHGAKTLSQILRVSEHEIRYPKGVKISNRDYFHRIKTIDLHILSRTFCESHAGTTLDFFHAYFEHTGANHWGDPKKPKREAINTITIGKKTSFIPDCILQITDPNAKKWLFVGEIYRGHDTKRVHNQLEKYLLSIKKGSINKLYNFMRGIPVLIICEQEGAMLALMRRLEQDPVFNQVENFFLFRILETVSIKHSRQHIKEIQEAFAIGWKTYTGKERCLFW